MDIDLEKEKIRKAMRLELKKHPETVRFKKSRQIAEKVLSLAPFQKAKTIMFYDATDEEVSTYELMEEAQKKGKRVLLPFIDQKARQIQPSLVEDLKYDLVSGSYDIMEPKPEKRQKVELNEIDLVIVPGLAFDLKGNRLGRGKGYYDRFLKRLPGHAECWGLAFDFQIVEQIPVNDLDVPVGRIVTNERN